MTIYKNVFKVFLMDHIFYLISFIGISYWYPFKVKIDLLNMNLLQKK